MSETALLTAFFFAAATLYSSVGKTSWQALGRVLTSGSALPLAGEPHPIRGVGRERYVYAPVAGVFATRSRIGDRVEAGDVIARIGSTPLAAPLAGVVRGLTRDGIPVSVGTKVIEIDPRSDEPVVRGIGERPRQIADGVHEAIRMWRRAHRSNT